MLLQKTLDLTTGLFCKVSKTTQMTHKLCEQCIIRQFNALKSMNGCELKKVSQLKESKTIKKGEKLILEGEKLNGVYCVSSGVTKLAKLGVNGKDQILKLAAKGELLGKHSLINKERSRIEVTALEDVDFCYIPNEAIENVLKENPNFSIGILQESLKELTQTEEFLLNITHLNTRQRIAHILLYIQTFGTDDKGFFRLTLSREEIASIAGIANESAIRMLSTFKKENLIQTAKRKIGIQNFEVLKKIAEGF